MRQALLVALVLAAASCLPGCADLPHDPAPADCHITAPRMSRGTMAEGKIALQWRMVSRADLFTLCPKGSRLELLGCTVTDEAQHTATIYMNDVGFGDGCQMMLFGHEVVHAMGAGHPK